MERLERMILPPGIELIVEKVGLGTMEEIFAMAKNRWKLLDLKWPSYTPFEWDRIELYKKRNMEEIKNPGEKAKYSLHNGDIIDMPKDHHYLSLINAVGLVIIEKFDIMYDFIPEGSFVVGFDYMSHLPYQDHGHVVPAFQKVGEKKYVYIEIPYNTHLDHDEIVPYYVRQQTF